MANERGGTLAPAPAPAGGAASHGAAGAACPAASVASLVVNVKFQNGGAPAENVAVKATGPSSPSGVTRATGSVAFHGIRPSPGAYHVTGKRGDVDTDAKDVNVACGAVTPVTLTLPGPVNPKITPEKITVAVRKPYAEGTWNTARAMITLKTDIAFEGTGTLEVTAPRGAGIRVFDRAVGGNEIRFDGKGNVFEGGKGKLEPGGMKLWIEGSNPSTKLDDIKLTLTLKSKKTTVGPAAKATVTAVEATLDICRSRTKAGVAPSALAQPPDKAPVAGTASDKYFGGRFVHEQDAGGHHGRAMLIIRRVAPADFTGEFMLTPLDARVEVFAAETGGATIGTSTRSFRINTADVPKDGKILWVQGARASGALRDSGLRLAITGLSTDMDRVRATVVKFSNVRADIPSTPARTNRMGNSPVARHAHTRAADFDEDFTTSPPLVLIEGSAPAKDVARNTDALTFSVAVQPAGVPVRWSVQRDTRPGGKGDHDDLVKNRLTPKPASAPTLREVAGNALQQIVITDAVGSFHVRPYVDCNGNGQFDHQIDREPYILMNLVLVRVKLFQDDSAAHPANFRAVAAGGGIAVSGSTNSPAFDITNPGNEALHFSARVDVIGGGPDGQRGLDMVFAGWVNNEMANEDIVGTYTDASVAPPVNHRHVSVFASNIGSANGAHLTGIKAFLPTDTAAALVAPPLLDSGRNDPANGVNVGSGGDSATLSTSRIAARPATPPLGQRFQVEAVDSPGDGEGRRHLGFAAAALTRFRFGLTFAARLCFWTNMHSPRSSGATGDPADRLYSVVRQFTWTMRGEWTVDPGTGAVAAVGTPAVQISDRKTFTPAVAASTTGVEVRPPTGLSLLARDCRS